MNKSKEIIFKMNFKNLFYIKINKIKVEGELIEKMGIIYMCIYIIVNIIKMLINENKKKFSTWK